MSSFLYGTEFFHLGVPTRSRNLSMPSKKTSFAVVSATVPAADRMVVGYPRPGQSRALMRI